MAEDSCAALEMEAVLVLDMEVEAVQGMDMGVEAVLEMHIPMVLGVWASRLEVPWLPVATRVWAVSGLGPHLRLTLVGFPQRGHPRH